MARVDYFVKDYEVRFGKKYACVDNVWRVRHHVEPCFPHAESVVLLYEMWVEAYQQEGAKPSPLHPNIVEGKYKEILERISGKVL